MGRAKRLFLGKKAFGILLSLYTHSENTVNPTKSKKLLPGALVEGNRDLLGAHLVATDFNEHVRA
jgi:hypothetical protein